MTEAEWLVCDDPERMLATIGKRCNFQQDQRAYRQGACFACACCHRIWSSLSDPRSRELVTMVEREIDGFVSRGEVWDAEDAAKVAGQSIGDLATHATALLAHLAEEATSAFLGGIAGAVAEARAFAFIGDRDPQAPHWVAKVRAESAVQASFLRDIFGNPFRPVAFDPAWRTDTAVSLARGMYDSRDFSAMPILADALQDAGCEDEQVLNHCREPGPHVRGCWVCDLVLGLS